MLGNLLRFVNDYEVHNVEPLILPFKNKWRVYYKSNDYIEKDTELSISYGEKYWQSR